MLVGTKLLQAKHLNNQCINHMEQCSHTAFHFHLVKNLVHFTCVLILASELHSVVLWRCIASGGFKHARFVKGVGKRCVHGALLVVRVEEWRFESLLAAQGRDPAALSGDRWRGFSRSGHAMGVHWL